MKRKDKKHTALFSAFVLISIAFDLHSRPFFSFSYSIYPRCCFDLAFRSCSFFWYEQSGN